VDVLGQEVGDYVSMTVTFLRTNSDESGRGGLDQRDRQTGQWSLPDGTVTFLFSDVAGSSRLWEADEEAAAAAIARHYELLDAAISGAGGLRPVEQGEGDSVVGVFESAIDALSAAVDVQRVFEQEKWPTGARIRVRLAVHSGVARRRDDGNYFGPVLIRCARLRSLAYGGQVLVSDATRDLVVDHLPESVSLRSLGAHRLKDLRRPERVWQLCHPDIDQEFPALRSLDSFPNNLPAQLSTLVGRQSELVELRDLLSQHRVVTLTGAGGCGKTRLATQLAADVIEAHPGGTWWVELAGLSDPELVTAAVATVVGVRPEPERPLMETLCEFLAGTDSLFVLDNCEHVLDATARFAEQLLRSTATTAVLATSREPLGITGEVAWRVPPLDSASAVQLFSDRAMLVRPDFAPDRAETEMVARICERLDGLPLAIELAAARTRMMRPDAIAAALDERFRLLTGGARTAQPRQQTLEASVGWSFDLLSPAEQALLRRLSVFIGSFGLDAAATVASGGIVDSYQVLDLLGRLVDKSLVQTEDDGPEGRYRLLETIRHFARDRLMESAETDMARERHLDWYLALAERAEPELGSGTGPAWATELEVEHGNLQAALEWADGTDQPESLLRLVSALGLFWEYRGHRHQGVGGRWFARALAVDHGPSVARARALWAGAHMGIYSGDVQAVLTYTPQALAVAETAGDQRTLARAGNTFNYVRSLFTPVEGIAGLSEAIALARSIGDEWAVADGLKMMSIAWANRGDLDACLETAHQLVQVATRLENKFFLAWSHTVAAYVARQRGNFARARQELEQSTALCDHVGDPITRWLNLCWLGEIDAQTGHFDSARARFEHVLHKGVASEGDLAIHYAVPDLGGLFLALGDLESAAGVLEPALTEFRNEVPLIRVPFLLVYARFLLATGDSGGAHDELAAAKLAAESLGNEILAARVDHELANLTRTGTETAEAEDLYHKALGSSHRHQLIPDIIVNLEALAGIAASQESSAEAARLFGASTAVASSIGLVRPPARQPAYDADVAAARQQLDQAAFAVAWAEGEALTIDEAVAYASRARGERKRPSTGWASLTPTELDVVTLVAKGLSNPEIGARLFIGRATVKTHLSHVFTKLRVTSRAELAALVTRRGL
jgi:predicted ATPase/class 3 adenylate cyclase/DNA-binding CsgD family transcriptional regulator